MEFITARFQSSPSSLGRQLTPHAFPTAVRLLIHRIRIGRHPGSSGAEVRIRLPPARRHPRRVQARSPWRGACEAGRNRCGATGPGDRSSRADPANQPHDAGWPSGVSFVRGLAEFERKLMLERTNASLAVARSAGRRVGREPALVPGRQDFEQGKAGCSLELTGRAACTGQPLPPWSGPCRC